MVRCRRRLVGFALDVVVSFSGVPLSPLSQRLEPPAFPDAACFLTLPFTQRGAGNPVALCAFLSLTSQVLSMFSIAQFSFYLVSIESLLGFLLSALSYL